MQWWVTLSPATPFTSVFGWGILFFLDMSHLQRQAEAKFLHNQQKTIMRFMEQAGKSDEVKAIAERAAIEQATILANRASAMMLAREPNASTSNKPTTQFEASMPLLVETDAPKATARKGRAQ